NINNLLNDEGAIRPEEKTRLTRLLSLLSLEPNLADTIADWLDADIDPTGFGGAEDGIYLRKSPAYRAANRALASITELRLVEGMTPEAFDALAQHVAALPTYTKVNINTATAEVIMSLNEGITANDVQSIISERDQGTFDSVTALQAFQANLSGSVPLGAVSVNSNYFLLESYATIGTASISLYSVLVRDNDSAATQILSRYIGTL
ncbi:MAG: type II secretion system minor pseudopilin GspK, partial [Gammaproteobacteria bacterium]|nr:type II secretion system minor pseudopilin GspK [Gammaproteobacteria bacterium]